jgi:hypothetical protein
MTHQVELSDTVFLRLQKLAVPLVDTIETVIGKLVDEHDNQQATTINGSSQSAQTGSAPSEFNPGSPPNLTHAKMLSAKLNGVELRNPTWNGLMLAAVRLAKTKATTADELRRLVIVHFVIGKKEDEGYKFFPDINLSIQGQEANLAWAGAFHIARQLGIPIEVEFLWRSKDGAAFPGVTGRMSA